MLLKKKLRLRTQGIALFWENFRESRTAMLGLIITIFTCTLALITPVISPYNPRATSPEILNPPSLQHLMGTDHLGRDVLSRVLDGIRISLFFAVAAAGLSLVIGMLAGSIAGYYGGFLDDLIMRIVDWFLMIPRFFLILVIIAIFGTNILFAITVVALTTWPTNARLIRADILSVKKRGYVDASRSTGASDLWVLFKHVIPNSTHSVITNSTLQLASAILIEAMLSFLGLGDVTKISLGRMLYSGYTRISFWWLAVSPGIVVTLLVVGFNLLGGGVNIAFNPRLREKHI